ncbi:MAG: A/G-specific adenine glycosylase [Candidatus Izemoplasmatales bacterium]|nr:A/G-specific adenine glycosylase [bacterium]MDZ4196465.1 A/G-specific adenine glycosylase [Candidatus Izemoplasmatales bacterium]
MSVGDFRAIKAELFQKRVLDWYDVSKRQMPWRETKNPYFIWISEIMLQQTRVETVIPYYERFIKNIPTIEALAQIDEDELLKYWEGLGYYSRARNLQKAAKQIIEVHAGVFPRNRNELENLAGIGPYTAGAILSIAFDKREVAIDGNVLRVFARLSGIREDISKPATIKQITHLVEELIPSSRNGDYTQSLMELGATICLPNGKPLCKQCPLKELCVAKNESLQELIPLKTMKKKRTIQQKTILVIMNEDNQVFIRKRIEDGLLKGMWEFMMMDSHLSVEEVITSLEKQYFQIKQILPLLPSTHIFSHLEWEMKAYKIVVNQYPKDLDGMFVSIQSLIKEYSLPTALKAYKDYVKEQMK